MALSDGEQIDLNNDPEGQNLSPDESLWFVQNILIHVLPYLEIKDLFRVSQVCKLWHDTVYSESRLWRSVKLRNSHIHFDKLAEFLFKLNPVALSLSDCTFADNDPGYLLIHLQKVPTLRKVRFSNMPNRFVELLPEVNSNFQEVIVSIRDYHNHCLMISSFKKLLNLQKLEIKLDGARGLVNMDTLLTINSLKHLSLTYIPDFRRYQLEDLKKLIELKNLEYLELGHCANMPEEFYTEVLAFLNISKLSLQNIKKKSNNQFILDAVKSMNCLRELELTGVFLCNQFYENLVLCVGLEKLTVVPKYKDKLMFNGITKLRETFLTNFTLGFTPKHVQNYKEEYCRSCDINFLKEYFSLPAIVVNPEKILDPLRTGNAEKFARGIRKILTKILPNLNVEVVIWQKVYSEYETPRFPPFFGEPHAWLQDLVAQIDQAAQNPDFAAVGPRHLLPIPHGRVPLQPNGRVPFPHDRAPLLPDDPDALLRDIAARIPLPIPHDPIQLQPNDQGPRPRDPRRNVPLPGPQDFLLPDFLREQAQRFAELLNNHLREAMPVPEQHLPQDPIEVLPVIPMEIPEEILPINNRGDAV